MTGPFDMKLAPVARGWFLGDYQGLEPIGDDLLAFFATTQGAGERLVGARRALIAVHATRRRLCAQRSSFSGGGDPAYDARRATPARRRAARTPRRCRDRG